MREPAIDCCRRAGAARARPALNVDASRRFSSRARPRCSRCTRPSTRSSRPSRGRAGRPPRCGARRRSPSSLVAVAAFRAPRRGAGGARGSCSARSRSKARCSRSRTRAPSARAATTGPASCSAPPGSRCSRSAASCSGARASRAGSAGCAAARSRSARSSASTGSSCRSRWRSLATHRPRAAVEPVSLGRPYEQVTLRTSDGLAARRLVRPLPQRRRRHLVPDPRRASCRRRGCSSATATASSCSTRAATTAVRATRTCSAGTTTKDIDAAVAWLQQTARRARRHASAASASRSAAR